MSEQEPTRIPPFLNKLMSVVLRSPLHRIASRSVMLITFKGRKSGRHYTTPISYARDGDTVLAFTSAKWLRNLAGGAPVTLNIKNKEYRGFAEVVSEDKEAVAEGLRYFLNFARFDARIYKVKFDQDGQPNREDCRKAAQGTNMIQIRISRFPTIMRTDT